MVQHECARKTRVPKAYNFNFFTIIMSDETAKDEGWIDPDLEETEEDELEGAGMHIEGADGVVEEEEESTTDAF